MFGATAIPAFLFFVAMFFVPESPRWLAKAGHDDRCERVLGKVGGEAYARTALVEIRKTLAADSGDVRGGLREVLDPRVRPAVVIGVVLAVFQQWCGINVIFNYAEEVFSSAGYGVSDILFNIVITGLVNLVFTFVAIGTVDRVGRKSLMLVGSGGLALIYLLIGLCYALQTQGTHLLLLVVSAIALYSCSLAPVTWVVLSEIFPNRIRGGAMALAVFALWAGCFTLTYTFPLLNRAFGPAGTFWIYAAICVLGFAFILLRLPETKGKTLEEIESQLEMPGIAPVAEI
jgi:sugar porter (SP) family MFS transporter